MMTIYDVEISREVVKKRVAELVNQFYKILPLRENESDTLSQYSSSLLREMLGMKELIKEWHDDGQYVSLLGILQFITDNPRCDVATVKSDVFKAINIIKRLQAKYTD